LVVEFKVCHTRIGGRWLLISELFDGFFSLRLNCVQKTLNIILQGTNLLQINILGAYRLNYRLKVLYLKGHFGLEVQMFGLAG